VWVNCRIDIVKQAGGSEMLQDDEKLTMLKDVQEDDVELRLIASEEEQKEYLRKTFACHMMYEYQDNGNISDIQKLYEFAHIKGNQKLVERVRQGKRVILESPYQNIYVDMIFVLADEIVENAALAENYIALFEKRYNRYFHFMTEEASSGYKIDGLESMEEKNKCWKELLGRYQEMLLRASDAEAQFLLFAMLYRIPYKQLLFPANHKDKYYELRLKPFEVAEYIDATKNKAVSARMDWCDSFLDSKTYQRYISRRIKELAEFIEESEDDLILATERVISYVGYVSEYYIRTAYLFRRHGLSIRWWEDTIQKDNVTRYVPDVRGIMEDYYRAYFFNYWLEMRPEVENITKVDVLRYTKPGDPSQELENIIAMCEQDVVCQMYQELLEQYYANFSFEQLLGQPMKNRYDRIIAEYEKEASLQHSLYRSLQKENARLLELINSKDRDPELEKYTRESNKELERALKEIEHLKGVIRSQEDYIEEIVNGQNEAEAVPEMPSYDLPKLQSKKYLFVGDVDSCFRELRRAFPGSVFMAANTDDISSISVDAVVYLIKCMSHSMYYKVQNLYGASDVPIIRYNGKNLELLYQEMQRGMEGVRKSF